jgi:hypothetical protein
MTTHGQPVGGLPDQPGQASGQRQLGAVERDQVHRLDRIAAVRAGKRFADHPLLGHQIRQAPVDQRRLDVQNGLRLGGQLRLGQVAVSVLTGL